MTTTTEAEPQASPPDGQRGDRIFAGPRPGRRAHHPGRPSPAVFIFLADRGHPRHQQAGRATTRRSTASCPTSAGCSSARSSPALIALVIAVPFALGIALFISHYAPRALAVPVAYVIDLLAAVPVGGLRPLGRAHPRRRYLVTVHAWLDGPPRLHPVLQGPGLGHRQDRAHRRPRAGDHDPADHHRDLPGDLRADPAAQRGGRAGPGRHQVGDDPATRSSPTPAPAWSPRSCSGSAARSARRWRWRWCSRPARSSPST